MLLLGIESLIDGLVVLDLFTKMIHFVSGEDLQSAPETTKLLIDNAFQQKSMANHLNFR